MTTKWSLRDPLRLAALAALATIGFVSTAPAQSADADQARAKELVLRIRKSMREIDSLLLKGSEPASPDEIVAKLAANQKRIDDLLQETEAKSQVVIKSLDELVDLSQKKG